MRLLLQPVTCLQDEPGTWTVNKTSSLNKADLWLTRQRCKHHQARDKPTLCVDFSQAHPVLRVSIPSPLPSQGPEVNAERSRGRGRKGLCEQAWEPTDHGKGRAWRHRGTEKKSQRANGQCWSFSYGNSAYPFSHGQPLSKLTRKPTKATME